MNKLQKIVVGIDFEHDESLTEGSSVAARQALWLAARTGAQVEFIHSTYRDPEEPGPPRAAPGDAARRQIEDLVAGSGSNVTIRGLALTEAKPWFALIQRALANEADLVVVAKRNHSRRTDRRLGSVSMKLVRKCPVPVWVVKPEHPVVHQSVLAATDLSLVGDLATEYAAFVADADQCKLCVVHAWQVPMELQLSAARIGDDETARQKLAISRSALEHIRGVPSIASLGDRAEILLACDTPSSAILQLAEREQPDLVVMGTISRGGLAGLLVGNTAEKLLYQLDCSILTVKPEDFVCPLAREDVAMEAVPLLALQAE